ncbi:formylglycine-generating enzyme family protein [Sphaerothrix gracilis]|uniref:formylglycine-generating enzyme family protein n=1 Tax=Sphaerothrix gracilis TaxID=3151835 RepID=UPI0031FC84CF
MIEQFIAALQDVGLVLSQAELDALSEGQSLLHDEDIADTLWLAAQMGEPVSESKVSDEPQGQAQSSGSVKEETGTTASASPSALDIPAYIPESKKKWSEDKRETSESGLPLQVQAAPSLPNARAIARSLRPLMRKAPSRTQQVLDEIATVDRIAAEDIWIPVLKPALERWFSLDLVIESSRFSFVWESPLAEFQSVLERQGAFRNVRAWSVEAKQEKTKLLPKTTTRTAGPAPEDNTVPAIARSPRELIDASGRALVFYISDCRSHLWRSGKIHEWLKLWSQHQPTAVVQLLPERLWSQTELNVGHKVQVSAFAPGVANTNLKMHNQPTRRSVSSDSLTLPVVTLTVNALQQWACVVTAAGQQRLPARLFDLDWVTDTKRIDQSDWTVIEPQTPEARLELFNATASPMAKRLARLMSVVPVDLPVVHLIQKTFFEEAADSIYTAEVYDSCLLEPIGVAELGEGLRYDFFPGVRELLNPVNPIDETLKVLDVLSKEIARTLGFEINSFTALLYPHTDWGEKEKAAILPFARIATHVLHRLGGQYADLAQQVEQDAAQQKDWLQPEQSQPVFPEFKLLEFETAKLLEGTESINDFRLIVDEFTIATVVIESNSELEQFEFDVATISRAEEPRQGGSLRNLFRRQSPNSDWVIRRRRGQARRFIELLGDTQLEMVAIPAGKFLMGSPEAEPVRSPTEGPQHEVAISNFFMARYPVTQAQWRFVAGLPQKEIKLAPDPSNFEGDRRPVERVSWDEAVEFCQRLAEHTGRSYRLPSEAEWEYACRAGTTTPFHFGDTLTAKLANYDARETYSRGPKGDYRAETTPVDHFGIGNAFGLSDMHGNVREWCEDHWHSNYEGAPEDGSAWLMDNKEANRVSRGGSWYNAPWNCRSAYRYNLQPGNRPYNLGFRVVCSAPGSLQ